MNGFKFNRIRAEYKISYRLDDVIYLYEDLTKDSKTFVYKDKLGNIYTVIEFSNFIEITQESLKELMAKYNKR